MCEKGIDTIYVFNTFRTDLLILIVRYCSSGSLQKVDATYLSPHVNMAARLETASRQYGKWTWLMSSLSLPSSLSDSPYLILPALSLSLPFSVIRSCRASVFISFFFFLFSFFFFLFSFFFYIFSSFFFSFFFSLFSFLFSFFFFFFFFLFCLFCFLYFSPFLSCPVLSYLVLFLVLFFPLNSTIPLS